MMKQARMPEDLPLAAAPAHLKVDSQRALVVLPRFVQAARVGVKHSQAAEDPNAPRPVSP
jgi:hypothetical protein